MGKIIAIIAVSAVFATICAADEVEITTPMGKIKVRVETDEVEARGRETREEVNLTTPTFVEARIRHDIKVLRERYIQKLSKKDRRGAMAKLDELEDLTTLLCSYFELPADVPVEPVVRPTPMRDEAFASFISQLKKEGISDNKLTLVQTVAAQSYFTINQVCQVMGYLSMDDDKVEVVRICYPKVIDRDNSFKLLDEVTFSDSKEKIGTIIKNQ